MAKSRDDGLSRDRIIDAAVELLDTNGADGFSFRALAKHLETGAGAIYWHVENKDELLSAATDVLVSRAIASIRATTKPKDTIRKLAIAVYELVDAHPWVSVQLTKQPWSTPTLQLFERFGRPIQAMKVPTSAHFSAATAILSYVIAASIQNAMNGRSAAPGTTRTAVLEREAARWEALDARAYPFTRTLTKQLREHDDLAQYLAGIDLILSGIEATI